MQLAQTGRWSYPFETVYVKKNHDVSLLYAIVRNIQFWIAYTTFSLACNFN